MLNPQIKKIILLSFGLGLLLLTVSLAGLTMGSTTWPLNQVLQTLGGKGNNQVLEAIIWKIRFPRVVLALLVGGSLSLGGMVFQAILRNPLAEPYILGLSGGAAIGAILAMTLGLAAFPGQSLFSLGGSLSTLAIIFLFSSTHKIRQNSLLLTGVMVNAFCSAIIMFLISISAASKLHDILFWLMGNLFLINKAEILILLIILIPCFAIIFFLSHKLNILVTGEETAQALGIDVHRLILLLLGLTSIMVSTVVCFSGLIGFVGLVIPHICRLLFGPDHRILTPACLLGGGIFLTASDLVARLAPGQGELPVGVITALIGAPAFILLLLRERQ